MAGFQPEHARFFLQSVALPWIRNEHPITRKVIEAVPVDQGDYRPDAVSRTAFELAWHIAFAENRFLAAVAAGEFDFSGTRPEWVRNSADVSRWYAEEFGGNFKRLEGLSDAQLVKIIDFRGILQFPAVMFLLSGQNHTIHHRGQLSQYLRPMGAKVPSIYGQSYDDAQALANR